MVSQIYIFVAFSAERPSSDPFLVDCSQNKLFVIGEYGVSKIVEIPLLPCYSSYTVSGFLCLANSRLFFVGGTAENNTVNEGIMALDLDSAEPLCNWKWKKTSLGFSSNEFLFTSGAVSGNLIYAVGWQGEVLAFDSKTMNVVKRNRFYTTACPMWEMRCYLLAVTETRIYVNCIRNLVRPSDKAYSVFGYWDIDLLDWNVIHQETSSLWSQDKGGVVIGEKYLIYFFKYVPQTGKFRPGLYVYDIRGDKWLKKPVRNLLNNGFSFPSDARCSDDYEYGERVKKYGDPITCTSLMRIPGPGKPELAFVWRTLEENNTSVFHVSRFTLDFVDGAGRRREPTFSAEKVRHHVHFSVPKQVYESKAAPYP